MRNLFGRKIKPKIQIEDSSGRLIVGWSGATVKAAAAKRDALLAELFRASVHPSYVYVDGVARVVVYPVLGDGVDPSIAWGYEWTSRSSGSTCGLGSRSAAMEAAHRHVCEGLIDETLGARTSGSWELVSAWAGAIRTAYSRMGHELAHVPPDRLRELASHAAWQIAYRRAEMAGAGDPHRAACDADLRGDTDAVLADLMKEAA